MITLIYGKNSFLSSLHIQDIVGKFVDGGGSSDEVAKIWVEKDTDVAQLLLQMQNISLFSPKKLTILYDISQSSELIEKLEQFYESSDENNWLMLVDSTLQARSKIVKAVEKMPDADVLKAQNMKSDELVAWASSYVQSVRSHVSLKHGAARHLVEQVGEDQQLLAGEIQKLVFGMDGGEGEISNEYIDRLVEPNPQSSVFSMLDATLAGNPNVAMELYVEQIAQGSVPQQIIGMFVWQLTQLAIVVDAGQLNNKELTDKYGVSSFAISKLRPLAQKLNKQDLAHIVTAVMEADYYSRVNATADDAVEYIVSYISAYVKDKKTASV